MHPSDGTLRRSLDEPFAIDARSRRHLETCRRCAERLAVIGADAATSARMLATSDPSIDIVAARARLHESESRAAAGGASKPRIRVAAPRGSRTKRVVVGMAVAAAASTVLVVSGGAQDFLSIFQPTQFAAVPVTTADIRSLAGLASYGTVTGGPSLAIHVEPDATAAGIAAGISTPVVVHPPAGVPATPTYAVVAGGSVSFTFDAARARAAAARAGHQLPAMPAGLDGSTLTVTIAPAVVVSYGLDPGLLSGAGALPATGDALVVVASQTPTVTSTGVTVQQLENYLLSVPGIPAAVASEIHAIGDPTETVPVPIPIDVASGSTVDINGASGLLIGDPTQLGSMVLWQHNGVVYAVAGTLSSNEVLDIARAIR